MSRPICSGVFNFIGIEPEFVQADGLAVGPEQRDAGSPTAWPKSSASPPRIGRTEAPVAAPGRLPPVVAGFNINRPPACLALR